MNFSNEEKIKIFDKIASEYFCLNFGSMSKLDFETLIFSEYIEHRLRNSLDISDYTISRELGITQSRVRSLKERKKLKYPYENFKWEEAFAYAVSNAKYDPNDHYIKMIIEDINVMNEIRHYIEQKGWYDECSLNKKLLKISLECFIDICLKNEDDAILFSDETKEKIKKLSYSENAVKEFLDDFSKDGLKTVLSKSSLLATSSILKSLPVSGFGGTAVQFLSTIIDSMIK